MRTYLFIRIVWLIVCAVGLVILLCRKSKNSKAEIAGTELGQQSELSEYQLRRAGLRRFEYTLIPTYVERLKEYPDEEGRFFLSSIWKEDIASVINPQYIDWDEISCEAFGDLRTEYVLLYDFPTPFDTPLAKYGAVYINKRKQVYNYYTLEKSLNGYMLCSPSTERHLNYGEREDMSKVEFIKEICNLQNIDEASLHEWRLVKSKTSVKEYVDLDGKVNKEFSDENLKMLIELRDSDYEDFIANHSCAIVCFYDACISSKMMINLLSEFATNYKDKIAVGIYDVYGIDNETIRAKMDIVAMPTFLIYKNGKVTQKHIGLCDRYTMKAIFEDLL